MDDLKFDPAKVTGLSAVAREGWAEPGVSDYVVGGMRTQKANSIETTLITAGSTRRSATAAGLTTPFMSMSARDMRTLVVAIKRRDNPRPNLIFLRALLRYLAQTEEDDAEKRRLSNLRDQIRVPPPNETKIGPNDIFTMDEVNRMLDAATSKRDRVLIATLYETGGRRGSILAVNLDDLQRRKNEDGRVYYQVWFTKMKETGTESYVYFREPATVALLDDWIMNYPAEIVAKPRPLIPSLSSAADETQRFSKHSVRDLLNKIEKDAGVRKHVHAHLFRHTRATFLLREGIPEPIIKQIMGWKPKSNMLARYAHLVTADVKRALGLSPRDEKAALVLPRRDVPAMPTVPLAIQQGAMSDLARQMASLEERLTKANAALVQQGLDPTRRLYTREEFEMVRAKAKVGAILDVALNNPKPTRRSEHGLRPRGLARVQSSPVRRRGPAGTLDPREPRSRARGSPERSRRWRNAPRRLRSVGWTSRSVRLSRLASQRRRRQRGGGTSARPQERWPRDGGSG